MVHIGDKICENKFKVKINDENVKINYEIINYLVNKVTFVQQILIQSTRYFALLMPIV